MVAGDSGIQRLLGCKEGVGILGFLISRVIVDSPERKIV